MTFHCKRENSSQNLGTKRGEEKAKEGEELTGLNITYYITNVYACKNKIHCQ